MSEAERVDPSPDLRDELDASVACGSGCIALFGPPGSGKTTLLLRYLVARGRQLRRLRRPFRLEHVTARAADEDPLRRLAHRLRPRGKRPRGGDGARLFGAALAAWRSSAPDGELHLVLDDADVLDAPDALSAALSAAVCAAGGAMGCVCLWLVAQAPLRVPDVFRRHFLPAPSAAEMRARAEAMFDAARPALGEPNGAETHRAAAAAVEHYASHLPMRAGAAARDVRWLLRRVHDALFRLAPHRAPNAVHYAAAWAPKREAPADTHAPTAASGTSHPNGGASSDGMVPAGGGGAYAPGDPLVAALRQVGYSAVLLAVSAFYVGAVPRARHADVFAGTDAPRRRPDANATSHRAAVLSSSVHAVHVPRLMQLYEALLRMCIHNVDPLEFAPPEVALLHVHTLVSWGLLVPTVQGSRVFRCHIPVTSAIGLAKLLFLNLYDLIPR